MSRSGPLVGGNWRPGGRLRQGEQGMWRASACFEGTNGVRSILKKKLIEASCAPELISFASDLVLAGSEKRWAEKPGHPRHPREGVWHSGFWQ